MAVGSVTCHRPLKPTRGNVELTAITDTETRHRACFRLSSASSFCPASKPDLTTSKSASNHIGWFRKTT